MDAIESSRISNPNRSSSTLFYDDVIGMRRTQSALTEWTVQPQRTPTVYERRRPCSNSSSCLPSPSPPLSPTPRRWPSRLSRMRFRAARTMLRAALVAAVSSSPRQSRAVSEMTCPPNHHGYAGTSDCTAYFWCFGGVPDGKAYNCGNGLLFDVKEAMCKWENEVTCNIGSAGGNNAVAGANVGWSATTPSPTPYPTPTPRTRAPTVHGKTIIGYYASWQWYDRNALAAPENMDFTKLQRVTFAFFQITTDGDIYGTDSWADPITLFGPYDWMAPADGQKHCSWDGPSEGERSCHSHHYDRGLIARAHSQGAEVYPSIGGWSLSDPFPAMASDPEARAMFAENCVALIRNYDFDGIDIDWEYPTYSDHSGTPEDTENWTLLLTDVRDALDRLGEETNQFYGLTAALPCGPKLIDGQEIEKISKLLTELNLMTYDFHGAWNKYTGVNAPLYDQTWGSEPGYSVDGCVRNWVAGGAPKEKINIGYPFYGRSFTGATRMNETHSGIDEKHWHVDEGSPQYYNIAEELRKGTMAREREEITWTEIGFFDDDASGGVVSFDDERAICEKTEYGQWHNLNGYIIWELSGDLMEDLTTPLLDAANAKLADPLLDCATHHFVSTAPAQEYTVIVDGEERVGQLGSPIYFGDFSTSSCASTNKPDWISTDQMFRSKKACCEEIFKWAPLDICLGPKFVETNIHFPEPPDENMNLGHLNAGMAMGASGISSSRTRRPTNATTRSPTKGLKGTGSPTMRSLRTTLPPVAQPLEPNVNTALLGEMTNWANTELTLSAPDPTSPPTRFATNRPSPHPTNRPSSAPTFYPTNLPTVAPTNHPTTTMPIRKATSHPTKLAPIPPTGSMAGSALSVATEGSTTIFPEADATIAEHQPQHNFGTHPTLVVDGGDTNLLAANFPPASGKRYDALLKFDLSDLGHAGAVDSAILRLYVVDGSISGGTFHTTVKTSWNEHAVTWNTAPAADGYSIGSVGRVVAGNWIEVDLTEALSWNKALTGGSDFISIRIGSRHSNRCQYNSLDSGENAPHLAVRFLQDTKSEIGYFNAPFPISVIDDVTITPTKSPTRSPVTAQTSYTPGHKLVLKATDDATIVAATPNMNFGYDRTLTIGGDSGTIDSLLQFDLTEVLSTPKSAILALYVEDGSPSAGTFVTTAVMDWSEGDVTWSSAPTYKHGPDHVGGLTIGTFGSVTARKWYGFDVSLALSEGNLRILNALTFRLSSGHFNQCKYSSTQSRRAPKLILSF